MSALDRHPWVMKAVLGTGAVLSFLLLVIFVVAAVAGVVAVLS